MKSACSYRVAVRVCLPFCVAFVVVAAACGGATSTGIGDAPGGGTGTGTGQADGSATTNDGSSSTTDGGVQTTDGGSAKDAGGAFGSDPGLVSCPPGAPCVTTTGLPQYCCIEPTPTGGLIGSCKSETISACSGHRISCDEKADCKSGICCAEGQSSGTGGTRLVTRCMATCITDAPRYQVCKSDGECENKGTCKAYDCGDKFPVSIRFCEKPIECK